MDIKLYKLNFVCRLSVKGYKKLACNMKQALVACQLPKHKVLATGLCNCLSPLTWKERLQRDPSVASQGISYYCKPMQELLNRWTPQLDLGCTTGGLERVVSVHNST